MANCQGEELQLFERLDSGQAISILDQKSQAKAAAGPGNIDALEGVYRDPSGRTPIFAAVKAAEARLLESQQTKSYLSAQGDERFVELVKRVVFGDASASDQIVGIQTPGGTAALRLGLELVGRADPKARIFVGTPTWPAHTLLIGCASLQSVEYPYYDLERHTICFDEMMQALSEARGGDVILLQGCCHNPTGADLTANQWHAVADLVKRRSLTPFIDLAYQGLGDGLEQDSEGLRLVVEAAEEALIAQSCDKNFGIYRDRTGALFLKATGKRLAEVALGHSLSIARPNWSMPPDHGAAVVRIILEDTELSTLWCSELTRMRARIRSRRIQFGALNKHFAHVAEQKGFFSLLPLETDAVTVLRTERGIFIQEDDRFNVVGMSDEEVMPFATAVLEKIGR